MISPKRIHPFNFTEISGVEVYASVETDIQSNSPVILLTARSTLSQVLQSFQAGVSDKSFIEPTLGLKIGIREELWRHYNWSLASETVKGWWRSPTVTSFQT